MVTYRSLVPGFLVLVAGVLFFGSPAYACPQGLVCAPGKSCPPEENCVAASEPAPATAPAVTSSQSSEVREQGQAPRQFEGDSLRTATERGARELLEGGRPLVPGTAPTRTYDTATISSQIGNIQRAMQKGETAGTPADQTPDASDPPQGPWPATYQSFLDWLYYPGYADGLPPGTGIPPGTGPMLPYPGYPAGLPPGPTPGPLPTGDPIPGDDTRPTRDDNVDPDRELGAAAGVLFGSEVSASQLRATEAEDRLQAKRREFEASPLGSALRAQLEEARRWSGPDRGTLEDHEALVAAQNAYWNASDAHVAAEMVELDAAGSAVDAALAAMPPRSPEGTADDPSPASVGLAVPEGNPIQGSLDEGHPEAPTVSYPLIAGAGQGLPDLSIPYNTPAPAAPDAPPESGLELYPLPPDHPDAIESVIPELGGIGILP